MVAESDCAHRPAPAAAVRSASTRNAHVGTPVWARRSLGVLLSALTLLALVFAPTLAGPPARAVTSTSPLAAATPEGVTVTVTPTSSPELTLDQDLVLTVTVSNTTTTDIPSNRVEIYLAQMALTTRGALDSWLRPNANANPGDRLVSVPGTDVISAGSTVDLSITVPSADIPLSTQNAWGTRGIAAVFISKDSGRTEGRGTFVWSQGSAKTPVALATVVPITTPASTSGLITATDLAIYTGFNGVLSSQLDAVLASPSSTIAIDPKIIASIRLLGTQAPDTATAWLVRLAEAENDIFPLAYADADIALQSQAGATTLLAPTSFEALTDPTLFMTPTPAPSTDPTDVPAATSRTRAETTPTPTPTSEPAPAVQPGEVTLPTLDDLLAWNYTTTSIGWPRAGQVERADLDVFAASGLTTTILSSGNVQQSDTFTANTAVALPTGLGLVSDTPLSNAIRRAAEATTDSQWRVQVSEAAALLAIVSAENPNSARTLLVTLNRSSANDEGRLGQTLAALHETDWSNPASLAEAMRSPVATTVSFDTESIETTRVNLARSLLERETAIASFATILADPLSVTAEARLDLLALFNEMWAAQPANWQEQVSISLANSAELLDAVTVTTRGPIIVVGSKVDLRITLTNALDQAVTVRTEIVPSNGRLVVGKTTETTIQPNSAQAVSVPLSAAVGNGDVVLRVTLYSPNGTPLGQSAPIEVSVRADWEGLGASIFALLVVGFFGFGIWRNIARRRRERVEATSALTQETSEVKPDVEGQH